MKILSRFITLILILISATAYGETPWENYLSKPIPERARLVNTLQYSPGNIPAKYGYRSPDLLIIRNQVLSGDSEAFRLTYRLMEKSDGALLEELTVILSHTIRSRPVFFLKELSALNPSHEVLKNILLMPGEEYVDRKEAQSYEIAMRAKALRGVNNTEVKSFRKKCLAIFKGGK